MEADDCSQELFLHLLRPGVRRAVEGSREPAKYVAFHLWARAHAYEREMRRQGLIFAEDQYFYSPGVVKAGLEVGLNWRAHRAVPSWPSGDEEGSGCRSMADPAEGNNLQAIMLDVLRGFDLLGPADRAILVRNHLDGLTLAEIAGELGEELPAVRQRHKRAVDRLIELLGGARRLAEGEHEGPGGRVAVSNEQANLSA